jgi:hypothetical protein
VIKSQDPPYTDPNLIRWVRAQLDTVNRLIEECPEPLSLTEDTLVALIHLIGALDL